MCVWGWGGGWREKRQRNEAYLNNLSGMLSNSRQVNNFSNIFDLPVVIISV